MLIYFVLRIDSNLKLKFGAFGLYTWVWTLNLLFNPLLYESIQTSVTFRQNQSYKSTIIATEPNAQTQCQFPRNWSDTSHMILLENSITLSIVQQWIIYMCIYFFQCNLIECLYHLLLLWSVIVSFQDVLWTGWTICFICWQGC